MRSIYLDHAAATPLADEVAAAMLAAGGAGFANPASQHRPGREARRIVEAAREAVLRILGGATTSTEPDRLVFTSGGTEANHLALLGLAGDPPGRVVVSTVEHPCVAGAAEELARRGFEVRRVGVDRRGVVCCDRLEELLRDGARLVSVMLANHETGVLQPLHEVVRIARRYGALVHTDAAQAVGKLPVSFQDLGVDAMTVSPHKFSGPRGIGGLLLRNDVRPRPQLFGGFQQEGFRPGTESPTLAAGFARAAALWEAEGVERTQHLVSLRDRFESRLTAADGAELVGAGAPRAPHLSCVAFRGRDRQALAMALDLAGVACSTGSACASGSSEPSPILRAMGLEPEIVGSSLRFSFGRTTACEEIDEAVRRIAEVAGIRSVNPSIQKS